MKLSCRLYRVPGWQAVAETLFCLPVGPGQDAGCKHHFGWSGTWHQAACHELSRLMHCASTAMVEETKRAGESAVRSPTANCSQKVRGVMLAQAISAFI